MIGVCAIGATAGLYLKPDLQQSGREPLRPAAAVDRPGSTAEAQALQDELRIAVADVNPGPATVTGPAGGPLASQTPALFAYEQIPSRGAADSAERAPIEPLTMRERVASVYRSIVAPPPASRVQAPPPRIVRPDPPIVTPPPPRPTTTTAAPALPPPVRLAPAPSRREPPLEALEPPPPAIAPAPPPRAPSFDCGTIRSAAEDLVCADPRLAALDRQMAAELMGAMAAGHDPNLLLRDQNDWLGRRDRAAPDPRAVADQYQRRIGQLRSMQ